MKIIHPQLCEDVPVTQERRPRLRSAKEHQPTRCGQPRTCSKVKHRVCFLLGRSQGTNGHFQHFFHLTLGWAPARTGQRAHEGEKLSGLAEIIQSLSQVAVRLPPSLWHCLFSIAGSSLSSQMGLLTLLLPASSGPSLFLGVEGTKGAAAFRAHGQRHPFSPPPGLRLAHPLPCLPV